VHLTIDDHSLLTTCDMQSPSAMTVSFPVTYVKHVLLAVQVLCAFVCRAFP